MSISAKSLSDLLAVSNLHSGYGKIPVLTGVHLSVQPGEFVGILGHNGMGKTTFLRSLMGHIRLTTGSITFDNQAIETWAPERRAKAGLGYVPQGRQIFPSLSVLENLKIASLNGGGISGAHVDAILETFPRLKSLLERQGGVLSGGEQQLLAIARCLVAGPKLILLDEPTEGIQPSIIDEIQDRLLEIKVNHGITFLMVEQNLDFIQSLSDRVLVLQKGRITRELKPEEFSHADLIQEFAGLAAG